MTGWWSFLFTRSRVKPETIVTAVTSDEDKAARTDREHRIQDLVKHVDLELASLRRDLKGKGE